MHLSDDFLKHWEEIVDSVDKSTCPVECVKKVVFKTKDRKQKTINLKRLREQGLGDESIEQAVENYLHEHDDDVISMEFVLDIEAVAKLLQPETDRLLRDLS